MIAPSDVARGGRELRAIAAEFGRAEPIVAVESPLRLHAHRPWRRPAHPYNGNGRTGERAYAGPITGDPPAAAERFVEYTEAGAEYLLLGILGDDWERQCELLAEARTLLV